MLVVAEFDAKVARAATGRGTLVLGETAHDPLAEVEIVEIISVAYSEADSYARTRSLTTVDAEAFLPYAYGKVDDWTALDNEKEAPWGAI